MLHDVRDRRRQSDEIDRDPKRTESRARADEAKVIMRVREDDGREERLTKEYGRRQMLESAAARA